jgi:hypothetical protein
MWQDTFKFIIQNAWLNFTKIIEPIKEYIMTGIILIISAVLTYIGFDFFGWKDRIPPEYLWIAYIASGVIIFIVLALIVAAVQAIVQGEDISFGSGKSTLAEFRRNPKDSDKDVSEVPIFLAVKNRNKNLEVICSATIEKFEQITNVDGYQIDDEITKKLRDYNLLQKKVPRLSWREFEYQTPECEMKIPPNSQRIVEVARFRFMQKLSLESGKPFGNMGVYYCKNEDITKPFDQLPLGLYNIKIAINYKRDGENILRTKYFNGFIFVSIHDDFSGWNLSEGDIRDRMLGKGIIDSGDPMKNREIPKMKEKEGN